MEDADKEAIRAIKDNEDRLMIPFAKKIEDLFKRYIKTSTLPQSYDIWLAEYFMKKYNNRNGSNYIIAMKKVN